MRRDGVAVRAVPSSRAPPVALFFFFLPARHQAARARGGVATRRPQGRDVVLRQRRWWWPPAGVFAPVPASRLPVRCSIAPAYQTPPPPPTTSTPSPTPRPLPPLVVRLGKRRSAHSRLSHSPASSLSLPLTLGCFSR